MGTSLMTRAETETDIGMNETKGEVVSEMGDDAHSTEGMEMSQETESTRARYGSEEEDL
jgi:hypothetical protein